MKIWKAYQSGREAVVALQGKPLNFKKNEKQDYTMPMEQAYVKAWHSSPWVENYPLFRYRLSILSLSLVPAWIRLFSCIFIYAHRWGGGPNDLNEVLGHWIDDFDITDFY